MIVYNKKTGYIRDKDSLRNCNYDIHASILIDPYIFLLNGYKLTYITNDVASNDTDDDKVYKDVMPYINNLLVYGAPVYDKILSNPIIPPNPDHIIANIENVVYIPGNKEYIAKIKISIDPAEDNERKESILNNILIDKYKLGIVYYTKNFKVLNSIQNDKPPINPYAISFNDSSIELSSPDLVVSLTYFYLIEK